MSRHDLEQRRCVLFTMLTALDFRYPPGTEPALVVVAEILAAWGHRCAIY